jgi:hypothetical protein
MMPARWRGSFRTGRRRWPELPEQIELPADRPRPAVASHRGGRVALVIDADLHRGLVALARARARACSWCCRLGWRDCCRGSGPAPTSRIGSPIAGRSDAALDDLIGFFVNTLVLRTDTAGNPGFKALLGRVRAGNLAAYGHADLPFERLVEVLNPARSLSRHPLFQVMLAFETGAVAAPAWNCPGWWRRPSRSAPPAPSSTCRSG